MFMCVAAYIIFRWINIIENKSDYAYIYTSPSELGLNSMLSKI